MLPQMYQPKTTKNSGGTETKVLSVLLAIGVFTVVGGMIYCTWFL